MVALRGGGVKGRSVYVTFTMFTAACEFLLLFISFADTRFAMHKNDEKCIISRGMSRDFGAVSAKTPRGRMGLNGNSLFFF